MLTLSSARGRMTAGLLVLALPVGAGALASPASAARYRCSAFTAKGRAYAGCRVFSGHVRVRADCRFYPDLYSPWTGRGTWLLSTGRCPFGIRHAIIEAR